MVWSKKGNERSKQSPNDVLGQQSARHQDATQRRHIPVLARANEYDDTRRAARHRASGQELWQDDKLIEQETQMIRIMLPHLPPTRTEMPKQNKLLSLLAFYRILMLQ